MFDNKRRKCNQCGKQLPKVAEVVESYNDVLTYKNVTKEYHHTNYNPNSDGTGITVTHKSKSLMDDLKAIQDPKETYHAYKHSMITMTEGHPGNPSSKDVAEAVLRKNKNTHLKSKLVRDL